MMPDPNSERRSCVLCGDNDSKITLEHIYGNWMAAGFPEQTNLRLRWVMQQDPDTGEITERGWEEKDFRHQSKLKVLCEDCNVGWGSGIESNAKEVLTPLIRGDSYVVLPLGAQRIATWAMKIAILREYFDPPEMRVIPEEQRHYLRRTNEPPAGTAIFAGMLMPGQLWAQRDRHRVMWINKNRETRLEPTQMRGVKPNTYVSTFGFGSLFLVVVGNTNGLTPGDVGTWYPDMYVRIWPEPSYFPWPYVGWLDDPALEMISESVDQWFIPPDELPSDALKEAVARHQELPPELGGAGGEAP